MSFDDPRPYRNLGGEELRRKAKRADVDLAHQIARMRAHDPEFREVLDRSLALDDEIVARKNTDPGRPVPPHGSGP